MLRSRYFIQGQVCKIKSNWMGRTEMPHRKRILLSDDNEGFSTLLLESLHEHGGFHVFHAREEHEVMETIQCHKPHILLLDDMLPHKGGLHVLRQLQERGHRLSTILMTVLPTQKIVRDATELGASYVFPKPFSSQAVIKKIQELLKHAPPTKH